MEEQTKKRKGISPLFWFLLLIILFAAAGAAYWAINLFLPNTEQIPFKKYFSELKEEEIYIIVEDQLIDADHLPTEKDGKIFLPADFVKQYIDEYIFWDEKADRLTYTTDYEVIHFGSSEDIFFKDGIAYILSDMLMELYNVEISFNKLNNMVLVDYKDRSKDIFVVSAKASNLRYEPDKKSPIERKLTAGTEVIVYGEQDAYSFVRTSDGILGYVLTKDIKFGRTIEKIEPEEIAPYQTRTVAETGKINILFEQFANIEESRNTSTRVAYEGLDVLCPVWFIFDSGLSGDILDIADRSYVDWAHENGIQVWALVTNKWDDDIAQNVLNDTLKREYVIEQLLNFVSMYELDGINIDFENFTHTIDGEYFVQFIRELAPPLKELGVILSVDMLVPKPYNLFYNRTEVGKSADFIIVMAYDEYWYTSTVSGPNASIGYADEGILETLKEVPKEKVILGIPYYNRVWTETETDGGVTARASDYKMASAYNLFIENGAEFKWYEETKYYYAEYKGVENGKKFTRKVWLEDERSIEEKLKLVEKYDISGIAGWRKGFEKEIIWDLLYEYLKK